MKTFLKLIIIVALVVVILLYCKNDNVTNEITTNKITVDEANLVYENKAVEENIEANNEISDVVNNLAENNVVENLVNSTIMNNVYEADSDVGTTNKKEEAINIVKQAWGEDSDASFRVDSVTTDGKYIIAVVSKSNATVKNYFIVDLEKKTCEVDY